MEKAREYEVERNNGIEPDPEGAFVWHSDYIKLKAHSAKLVEQAFDNGYICAVANLIRMHDEPTMARDMLRANMPSDWRKIAPEDKKVLREAGFICRSQALKEAK